MISSGALIRSETTNSLKNGPLKSQLELARQVVRLRQILHRQFAQALLAVDRHENRRHQGDQRLIGADIGSGFLAADVLLAGRQRQTKRAIAAGVLGFADQASRDLANEFFFAGDDAGEWSAVAGRDGEGLQFAGDDIGVARRLQQSQRNGFGENEDQQRAVAVRDRGGLLDVFDDAEEVGRLNDDGRGLVVDFAFPDRSISSAPFRSS